MSEQIREQVSEFRDGDVPNSEPEQLLKRLTREGELRESFGRYALIGEAIRGTSRGLLTRGFAGRVNLAIDGELIPVNGHASQTRGPRWWRPFAGAAVAAGGAGLPGGALRGPAGGAAMAAGGPLPGRATGPPPRAGPLWTRAP